MIIDWIRRQIVSRISGRCPVCGSKRVSVELTKHHPIIVDGHRSICYHCRSCGHTWKLPVRIGI